MDISRQYEAKKAWVIMWKPNTKSYSNYLGTISVVAKMDNITAPQK